MADHATRGRSANCRPLRPMLLSRVAGIVAKSGDDQKHMTVPCINADPIARPALAVTSKFG